MKQVHPSQPTSESGNAIWFVLLGIGLLAALTLAIARFSDTEEDAGNKESASIQASTIMRVSKGMEQAVGQMQMHEVAGDDISFDTPALPGYANPNCTKDDCKIFKPAGGGQTYAAPDTAWLDSGQAAQPFYGQWIFTGKTCVQGVGNQNEPIGTDCSADGDPSNEDLVMLLPYVTLALCKQLDQMLGVGTAGAAPPVDTNDIWTAPPQFLGVYANGSNIGVGNTSLYRKAAGCLQGAGTPPTGTYTFYQVLLAR